MWYSLPLWTIFLLPYKKKKPPSSGTPGSKYTVYNLCWTSIISSAPSTVSLTCINNPRGSITEPRIYVWEGTDGGVLLSQSHYNATVTLAARSFTLIRPSSNKIRFILPLCSKWPSYICQDFKENQTSGFQNLLANSSSSEVSGHIHKTCHFYSQQWGNYPFDELILVRQHYCVSEVRYISCVINMRIHFFQLFTVYFTILAL